MNLVAGLIRDQQMRFLIGISDAALADVSLPCSARETSKSAFTKTAADWSASAASTSLRFSGNRPGKVKAPANPHAFGCRLGGKDSNPRPNSSTRLSYTSPTGVFCHGNYASK